MAVPRAKASAQYKKQDGEIQLSGDGKTITWTSNISGSAVPVKLAADQLTNLQQTPATSTKAVLKLFVQAPGASAPETYNFTFSSPTTARDELNAFIEPLKKLMEAQRSSSVSSIVASSPTSNATATGATSSSMAIAQAVSSSGNKDAMTDNYSDEQLLANSAFQKALLDKNPSLRERMTQAMKDRPQSMTVTQLMRQFWTSRIHLLRAHAAEQAQQRGEYNVISDIRRVKEIGKDGNLNEHVQFTASQIRMIWQQYPFMVKVHHELFKKKAFTTEEAFWADWVTSRLYKKMKGERITEQDWEHPHFDRYLDLVDTSSRAKHFTVDHIPRFIDMEGNEQNHSQKQGNAPDFTMKPAFSGRNQLLNTLNNMSERLLMNVNPSDAISHGPAGLDEETYNELRLRDLQRDDRDNRVMLNIADQRHIAPSAGSNGTSGPTKSDVRTAVERVRATARDQPVLPIDVDEDEEPIALEAATDLMQSVKLRSSHAAPGELTQTSLSSKSKDAATMAQSTTIDFLHYFWGAYLSGDPTRAEDVKFLVETLRESKGRFDTVANQAEQERNAQAEHIRNIQKDIPASKRRKLDVSLPGGRQAVVKMLAATQEAVTFAEHEYQKTLAEQFRQAGPTSTVL